jgi:hypothetical protein
VALADIVGPASMLFGAGGGIGALFLVRGQKKKLSAETDKNSADYAGVISGTAISLLEPMREQLATMRAQLRAAHEEITALRTAMARLSAELDATTRDSKRGRT